ncbi:LexA family transcriptional regulator [Fibrisoma montanum]|uniref:LexA family transcriptional regulator n=1 Tax=Fibrisoma montanum TaxID=2305895 RepID=A0A418M265_9BACT|nr:LexA family transcriptional regulator [Fibrisoma montanum]RIV19754.1 LexA family transcriptional regulator [Fibrisoma montanum]
MLETLQVEMTLGQRLKKRREELKYADRQWTLDYVAKKLGVTKGAVSQYENDETKPSRDILLSIAKLYGTTAEELSNGNRSLTPRAMGLSPVLPVEKTRLYLSQIPEEDAEHYIPYYDIEITAGLIELYFDEIDEVPEGYIYAPQYRGCIACNVKGDSMYDRIFPGSRLYVFHLKNLKYIDFGQIYLIVLDGYRLLKYIDPHPTDPALIILRSHNPHYKDYPVEKADILNLFLVKGYENQNAI